MQLLKYLFFIINFALFLGLAGCGGSSSSTTSLQVTRVDISPQLATLMQSESLQYTAIATYSNGTSAAVSNGVTWLSSNTNVASINNNGLAIALASSGTTNITAQYQGVTSNVDTLSTTNETVSSVVITPSATTLRQNETLQYTARVVYSNGVTSIINAGINWSSSNPNVATINNAGLAKVVASSGTTNITAQYQGVTSNLATITATIESVESVIITPTTTILRANESQQYSVTAVYSDGSSSRITTGINWNSSNPNVATINNAGLAKVVASSGVTNITAQYQGVTSNLATITVMAVTLQSIAITPAMITLKQGEIQPYTAVASYSDGSTSHITQGITWSSSNTSVVVMHNDGIASALATGNADITAAYNGVVSNTVTVNVLPLPSNQPVLAGYLSTGYMGPANNYVTIGQAAAIGYNVVILAFGKLDASQQMSFYNSGGIGFLAYDGGITSSGCPALAKESMLNDIVKAKASGQLKYVLISLGGQNSTFTQPTTTSQITDAATNIVNFLNEYSLDGVDFDLEASVDSSALHQLLVAIRNLKPTVILTAAPQINTVDGIPSNVSLVSTTSDQSYTPAVAAGDFDYVWAQAYNTGAQTNIINYQSEATNETMAEYIPAAYNYFISQPNPYITIPTTTKFILGEPATLDDGGEATVWHNPSYIDAAAVYTVLTKAYVSLGSNLFGAMAWTVNRDILGGCQFTNQIGDAVGTHYAGNCPTNTMNYWLKACHW